MKNPIKKLKLFYLKSVKWGLIPNQIQIIIVYHLTLIWYKLKEVIPQSNYFKG